MLRDMLHLITAVCQSRSGGSQCWRMGVVDAAAAKGEHRHPERVGWYHWTVDVSGKQETERILAGIHPEIVWLRGRERRRGGLRW